MEKPSSYCEYVEGLTKDNVNRAYHDTQYGFKIDSDNELFGRLILEINQAGLSWTTILNKQKNLRIAFSNYEIKKIDCLETFPSIPEIEHSYYGFVIKFNKELAGISRTLFVKSVNAEFLNADGWESVPLAEGYVEPLYLNPIYQNQIAIGSKS